MLFTPANTTPNFLHRGALPVEHEHIWSIMYASGRFPVLLARASKATYGRVWSLRLCYQRRLLKPHMVLYGLSATLPAQASEATYSLV